MVYSNITKTESDKHGKSHSQAFPSLILFCFFFFSRWFIRTSPKPNLTSTETVTHKPSLRTSRNNTRLPRCHDRCSRRTFLSRERRHVRAAVLVPIQQSTRNTRPAHVLAEPGTYPCQDTSSHCLRNILTPGVAHSCRRFALTRGVTCSCRHFALNIYMLNPSYGIPWLTGRAFSTGTKPLIYFLFTFLNPRCQVFSGCFGPQPCLLLIGVHSPLSMIPIMFPVASFEDAQKASYVSIVTYLSKVPFLFPFMDHHCGRSVRAWLINGGR